MTSGDSIAMYEALAQSESGRRILDMLEEQARERDGTARQALWKADDGWLISYTTSRVRGGPDDGKGVLEWVQEFDAGLDPDTTQDPAYDFRLFLIPHTGPKTAADAAMTFVRIEDLDEKQKATIDQVQTIIRDKQVPVSNLDLHRPGEVVELVSKRIGKQISVHDHTCAWRHFAVRPSRDAKKPEATKAQYCVWDRTFQQYVYTDAWVALLAKEFADETASAKIRKAGAAS